MKLNKPVLVAIVVGLCLGTLCGGLAILATSPTSADFIEQKYISLRYRVAEYWPHPDQPEWVPTPLPTPVAALVATPAAISSRTPGATATRAPTRIPTRSAPPAANIAPIQPAVTLRGVKHDYQRWNNCGPTTLEMALSNFGRTDSQAQIASFLKPNYDDRNVRPDEMAAYVDKIGLDSITRLNGTLDRLKSILSNGLPVIVETSLVTQPQGWMGHYRVLTGYDANGFTAQDSYEGPNRRISFSNLDDEWRAFNRLYLVIYPNAQEALVRALLADVMDDSTMYGQAVTQARAEIQANPKDAFAQFDLGSSLNGLKRYSEAAVAFDRARVLGLPWRMLWYQFGPFEAYLQVGRYDEVIALADSLLRNADMLEEAHYYKGLALRAQGRLDDARREFETALRYNKNYRDAQRALDALPKR